MSERQRLTLRVALEDVSRAETLLELAGAEALSLADAGDEPVLEPRPGETPLWPLVALSALFAVEHDLEPVRRTLSAVAAPGTTIDVAPLADALWRAGGRGVVEPQSIGRRLWLGPADSIAPLDRAVVRLRMGLAFGTGTHPTTALCLEWLEARVRGGERLIDYGCGSGVLALTSLALGAGHVWAVDNDPQALAATADNAALNDVTERITIVPPHGLRAEPADLLVANIVAGPLIELAPLFAASLRPGAPLVLSGVLGNQLERVREAYAPYFETFERAERAGWCRLVARRAVPSGTDGR